MILEHLLLPLALWLSMSIQEGKPPRSINSTAGTWVLHIDGESYRQGIEVLQIDSAAVCGVSSLSTRAWDGTWTNLLPIRAATCTIGKRDFEWQLLLTDGQRVTLLYRLDGDTLLGTLATPESDRSRPAEVIGVRITPRILPVESGTAVETTISDSTPVVLVRLDDGFESDRDFIVRLRSRALPAEIAVPTALVGVGKMSWADLEAWRGHGFEVVAHSRRHERTRGTTLSFLGEVLGSLTDVTDHGYDNRVFVQPGTWRDSLNFDSPAKLATWRGALLRTFTTVTEAYARPWSVELPLADSMALGIGHFTISNGATPERILRGWREAQQPGRFSVFLVHTWSLSTPNQLDWFLDSLAVAQREGRIRLVRSSRDVAPLPLAISLAARPP